MFELEKTPMWREVLNVVNDKSKPVHATYTAKIHVGKLTYNPLKILSIDILQDYENDYADEVTVKMAISGGSYVADIYPYKDQIEISITRSPLAEVGGGSDSELPPQTERFKATLIDTGNPIIEGNSGNTPTKDALDLTNVFEITFQLINQAIAQIRMITVGGTYRKTTAASVVRALLTTESKNINVPGIRLPAGVDLADDYNPTVREHVIIPQGTKLVDAPGYIHYKCGGIYPAGFGYYLQDNIWYIYPKYDVTRVDRAKKILTILNIPRNKLPGIERTYKQNGATTVILATGEVRFRDDTESQQLNFGNGVMFADANAFMESFATVENNKATVSRGTNNTEAVSKQRTDKLNNVLLADEPITANPYIAFGKLARRQGNIVTLVWENSSPSIATPGAAAKMLYIDNDKVSELSGTVLKAQHYISLKDPGLLSARFVCNTALSLFVKPKY